MEGLGSPEQQAAPLIGLLENASKQAQRIRMEIAAMKPAKVRGGTACQARAASAACGCGDL